MFFKRLLRVVAWLIETVYGDELDSVRICCHCRCGDGQSDPFEDIWIRARFAGMEIKFKIGDELKIMFTVGADHKDEPFDILPVTGGQDKDLPPNDIPAEDFSVSEVRTDNDAVVSIVDAADENGDPTGGKAAHFGAPGVAHTQYDLLYKGEVVRTYEASFNVTTGALDPNSIVGGGFNFPGLTPDA